MGENAEAPQPGNPTLVNHQHTFSVNGTVFVMVRALFGSGLSLCELLILLDAEGVEGSSVAFRFDSPMRYLGDSLIKGLLGSLLSSFIGPISAWKGL